MDWQELANPQRLKEMMSAIHLLDRWQQSAYQLPLLENTAAFYHEKERIAALLVDNHLGKLARKVRMLGDKGGLDSHSFLDGWAEISLFTLLWKGFEALPDGMKSNLIYHSGANITKKRLSGEIPFKDQFFVLGQDFEVEEQLLRRTVYFFGRSTQEFYTLIEYSFNQRPFEVQYFAGDVFEGNVVRYPFPGSLRISLQSWNKVLNEGLPLNEMKPLSMDQVMKNYHSKLKVNPFYEPFPVMIKVRAIRKYNEWLVTDVEGYKLRMAVMDTEVAAAFYAASFMHRILIFALITIDGLLPLSYFNGDYLIEFGQQA